MAKKYYWLKLKRDFFKRHDTRIVENMPNGEKYLLFYLKLLVESIDHEGNLRFSDTLPYNDSMLATITETDIDIVRSAIKLFVELGMMDMLDDGTLYMSHIESMIGHETEWAEKKRLYKMRTDGEKVVKDKLPSKYPYMLGKCTVQTNESIVFPNGKIRYVDEKRYGGNGKIVLARSDGVCENCGSDDDLVIHHANGYSNEQKDLLVLCKKCHGLAHTEGGNFPRPVLLISDKSKSKSKSKRLEKDKDIYGECENVLLSKDELEKLKAKFGAYWPLVLSEFSTGKEAKGYKYKNDYAALLRWDFSRILARPAPARGKHCPRCGSKPMGSEDYCTVCAKDSIAETDDVQHWVDDE